MALHAPATRFAALASPCQPREAQPAAQIKCLSGSEMSHSPSAATGVTGVKDRPIALCAEGINQYYGGSHILRDVSLEVPAGEVTVLLGRNGVGKTTLLKSLMGLVPIQSGSIEFNGQAITSATPYQRARAGIGFVPQGREIFGRLTVEDNLRMGLAYKPASTPIPPQLFELFPVLKQMLNRRGGDLSGGQQQQLAIARALAAQPQLIILDEPTEGIQPSIIKDIGRVIRMLASEGLNGQRVAVLLVEQYYDFAEELADHYLVMERGEVIARGPGNQMRVKGIRQLVAI
jgi:urea transport system ATP-binding protein